MFPQQMYPLTLLSQIYWMDTQKCYQQKCKNPTQLFELFVALSEEEPENIRSDMISRIKHECNYYEHVGCNHLKRIGLNINQWLSLMESPSIFGDELMLFALARTFHRHVVVFTRNQCWNTIGSNEYISGDRLLEICDVKLLYIGQHMFVELKPKPFIPIMKPVVSSLPNYSHLKSAADNNTPAPIDLSTACSDGKECDENEPKSALEDNITDTSHNTALEVTDNIAYDSEDAESNLFDSSQQDIDSELAYSSNNDAASMSSGDSGEYNNNVNIETVLDTLFERELQMDTSSPVLDDTSPITTSNGTPVIGINDTPPVQCNTATDQLSGWSTHHPPPPLQLPAIMTSVRGLNNEAAISRNITDTLTNDEVTGINTLGSANSNQTNINMTELHTLKCLCLQALSNSEIVSTRSTLFQKETTSTDCPLLPQVSKTTTILPVPMLTEISKAVLVSSAGVHTLKALCVLVIHCLKLPRNWVYTQNSTQKGDHNYNRSASVYDPTNIPGPKEDGLTDNPEQILHPIVNAQDVASTKPDIVIESMAINVPVYAENVNSVFPSQNPIVFSDVIILNTSYLQKDGIESAVSTVSIEPVNTDAETLSLDSSQETIDTPTYDPTGTTLILPLKKCKQVIPDPEKAVHNIWMNDALSCNWFVPLKKLSKLDIYDLSHKPPDWSHMDPYSGLEDESEDITDPPTRQDQIRNINSPVQTMLMDDPSCAIALESDIESSAYTGNRYQLRQQKACTPILKTRSSNRLKQITYYFDNSDNDSDYEPKPKRVRNPNVGLTEPSTQ